jgi:AcrR family transcriptional regulator
MLDRVEVIEAALGLVDAEGLAALNLRKLGTRLGVSAMTPYGYFADKDELLGAMVEHALQPLAGDLDTDASWDDQVRASMLDFNRALTDHPGLIELIIVESEAEQLDQLRQRMLRLLQGVGLPRAQSADALRTLTSYVLGHALLARLRPVPNTRGYVRGSFENGLDMIMASLRTQVLESAGTGATSSPEARRNRC